MKLYSTNDPSNIVDLKTAVLNSLPKDQGLYMPLELTTLDQHFIQNLEHYSFTEIAFQVCSHLFQNSIPADELWQICNSSTQFPAPVVSIEDQISTLELFHGPTLAFKDFGARFMASLMSYFNRNENQKLTILVATSGDTGGAVASGFYDIPNVEVIILYPKGRVSPLQEKQLTTLGKNIEAVELDGSFDDCQSFVKQAFLDQSLNEKYRFSSANSINIARLIPQSFYYFEAYKQLRKNENVVFCVPSGNYGNLTAGLLAKKMGLPIDKFIAATNLNKAVPDYLKSSEFVPLKSIATISNAMDVGNPSNFPRMQALYNNDWNQITKDIVGFSFNDDQTKETLKNVFVQNEYLMDPHGAVGYLGAKKYLASKNPKAHVCFLETAHPAKFLEVVEEILEKPIDVPTRLAALSKLDKKATALENSYTQFQSYLASRI